MIDIFICAAAGLVLMLAIYGSFRLVDDLKRNPKRKKRTV